MKQIKITDQSIASFRKKVQDHLGRRPLGQIISFTLSDHDLSIVFKKMGTSQINYRVTETPTGFQADHIKESIAMTHRPFRETIENKIRRMLTKLGATIST